MVLLIGVLGRYGRVGPARIPVMFLFTFRFFWRWGPYLDFPLILLFPYFVFILFEHLPYVFDFVGYFRDFVFFAPFEQPCLRKYIQRGALRLS